MAGLVDTNLLVYRFDPRDARKQRIATRWLRDGIAADSIRVAHQAVVEFYAARPVECPDGHVEIRDALIREDRLEVATGGGSRSLR